MTATLERPTGHVRRWPDRLAAWTVPAAVSISLLGRLPFIGRAPSPDEAGYLLVGGQWNGAGSSLYGDYWVDRPPGLVTIFRLAAHLGGVTALRLMGCVAVVVIVVGAARVARMLGGQRSERWSAVIAAALCLSPLLGVQAVNGELLAAPFVVVGVAAMVHALQTPDQRRAQAFAAVAGVLAVCAVMVKQNFVDVAVFAGIALVVAALRRDISRRQFMHLSTAFLVGALATLVLTALWTVAHGTSLGGVFNAMYPFRIEAGNVIAAGGRAHASARLVGLVTAGVTSGLLLLALAVMADVATSRRRDASTWALVGLLVFAAASVLVGGSYWHHYLIGLIVPVSITAGLMAGSGRRVVPAIVALTVASAAITWAGHLTLEQGSAGQTIGTAIGAASQRGDTIVSLYGHPDIVQTSGLPSPYEHLWSLPIKTLDPHLTELDSVLDGPSAPTWLVTGRSVRSWGLATHDVRATIAHHYRRVATICDRTVYLRTDANRTTPTSPTTCDGTTTALTHFKELLP